MPCQLRSSDGQLFELSDAAARQSITLKHVSEDVGCGAVPVPLDSGRLRRITALLKQTAAALDLEGMAKDRRDKLLEDGLPRGDIGPQLRADAAAALQGVDGLADFTTQLFDLKWFDSPLPMTILAEGVALLLDGKPANELRTLLVAHNNLTDQEKEAALREPLFAPPSAAVPDAASPPPLARSVSQAMDNGADDEGNMMACLNRCDAKTLHQLKAVSAGWQQRARRALFDRLCSRQGGPRPQRLEDVKELDVEELQHVGQHGAVAAVRQMPNLARLRGYGFTVDLQAVQQAALGGADSEAPLGGAALRGCIKGEGEPPHELLLTAVACAASGTVRGVPVQRLREDDAIGSLDLQNSGIGVISAELLGLMLPDATSVHFLRCAAGTTPLAQRAQPAFPPPLPALSCHPPPTLLNTSLHSRACSLSQNELGSEGGAALAKGLKGNTTLQYLEYAARGSNRLLSVRLSVSAH